MMRLICNGEALDLRANTRLALKKVNPIFAFDKITCERTTEFDLPATATNDRVFTVAKNPAYTGEGMRRRFDAQLQDGTSTKNGYLYVSKYSGGSYKAIFVTGELVGLKDIKDAGKVSEFLSLDDEVIWEISNIPDLPARDTVSFSVTKYLQDGSVRPSMYLNYLISKASQSLHFNVSIPSNKLRLIPSVVKSIKPTDVMLYRTVTSPYVEIGTTPIPVVNNLTINGIALQSWVYIYAVAEYRETEITSGTKTYRGNIKQLSSRFDMRLTFPDDWPEDLYVGRFAPTTSPYIGGFTFLGDRSFDKTLVNATPVVTRYGEPLAGRSVDIPRNTSVIVVWEGDYHIYDANGNGEQGWKVQNHIYHGLTLGGSSEAAQVNDVVRLQDNLPELTVVELLKIVAAHTGTALYYTDNDGVTFDPVSVHGWPIVDLTRSAIELREVSRTFGDYAQQNILKYTDADWISESQRIEEVYMIDNDNLEQSSDLIVLPVVEGLETMSEGRKVLYVENVDDGPYIIGDANTTAKSMTRAQIRKNAAISALCSQSTKVVARVRLSMYEYEQLSPKTAILINSVKYIWTESNWQDGVATLTLAKI